MQVVAAPGIGLTAGDSQHLRGDVNADDCGRWPCELGSGPRSQTSAGGDVEDQLVGLRV